MIKTISDRVKEMKKKGRTITDADILRAFDQAKHQEYKRMSRLYGRAKAIAQSEHAYFITLTYDDEHMENAKTENAKRWAKKHLSRFIGNDDWGKTNGRYHHHVFGNFKDININLSKSWKYGAINIQKFRGGGVKAITKYIDRITRHGLKDRTSNLFRSKNI